MTNFGIVVARIQTSPSTWSDALAVCKNDGSHVHQPIPKSNEENVWYKNFVEGEFSKFPDVYDGSGVNFWLGVNDAAVDNEFRNDKNEVQTYFNWKDGQPINPYNYVYMKKGSETGDAADTSAQLTGVCTYFIETSD